MLIVLGLFGWFWTFFLMPYIHLSFSWQISHILAKYRQNIKQDMQKQLWCFSLEKAHKKVTYIPFWQTQTNQPPFQRFDIITKNQSPIPRFDLCKSCQAATTFSWLPQESKRMPISPAWQSSDSSKDNYDFASCSKPEYVLLASATAQEKELEWQNKTTELSNAQNGVQDTGRNSKSSGILLFCLLKG